MSGEGTSRGLRVRPTPSKATSAAKIPRGRTKRFMAAIAPTGLRRGPCYGVRLLLPRRHAVAAIACSERAPQRHQETSAPDPIDEGFVLHADDPGRRAHGIPERYVQVAREAGIDRGFSHRHVLYPVDAFFGIKRRDWASVLVDLNLGASGDVVRPLHVPYAVQAERVAAQLGGVPRLHAHVALAVVAFHQRHSG